MDLLAARGNCVSSQANAIPGNAVVLFLNPFNMVASDITKGLKILTASGIIRQKINLGSTRQVLGAFFEAQDGKGAYQTDGVDLVCIGLISQGERSRRWFVRPTTSQTG
ncbi:hypothetical protein A6779_05420 [Marinobacter adhaerens]|jgi:hypothetical protein|nr:hypothetical protein A6779_05420 [Marinobacter adhaerens]